MGITNKEKILDWLYRLRSEIYVYMPKEWLIPMNNALDVAIDIVKREKMLEDWTKKCRKFEADYEARLKADMVKMLRELQTEIKHFMFDLNPHSSESDYACDYMLTVVQKKINELSGETK